MPAHFRIVATELDGPVFADSEGHTLYKWPFKQKRIGNLGDPDEVPTCTEVRATVNAGHKSPYPEGFTLPDLDSRPSCAQAWPPALAAADARPIGKWTLITRPDGRLQWAYERHPLYTSNLDQHPGDVLGGDTLSHNEDIDGVTMRVPIQPPPDIPPGFSIKTARRGRLLQTVTEFSVYASDRDGADTSRCDDVCARTWIPLLAPESARPHGAWSTFERSPGVLQWAFRHQPLYRYALDSYVHSFEGSDVPGWHNVYTQRARLPDSGFTVQDTSSGQVLADMHGRTIYTYLCGDDAADELACDHPTQTQAYRLAVCGGGDPERCLKTFPYVPAPKDAHCSCRLWSVVYLDPLTGRFAAAGQPGTVRVWAYRDRPVYTYAGDAAPGDFYADGLGEFRAQRAGFWAFWLRDDFNQRDQ
jgi:predicted lipoprotein with Yx(FWY)xxD motif